MKLSKSTLSAVLIAELIAHELMNTTGIDMNVNTSSKTRMYGTRTAHRRMTVTVNKGAGSEMSIDIDLQSPSWTWTRAYIEVYLMGVVYRSYHYAATLDGGKWKIRRIHRVLHTNHGPGEMSWDSGFSMDGLPTITRSN